MDNSRRRSNSEVSPKSEYVQNIANYTTKAHDLVSETNERPQRSISDVVLPSVRVEPPDEISMSQNRIADALCETTRSVGSWDASGTERKETEAARQLVTARMLPLAFYQRPSTTRVIDTGQNDPNSLRHPPSVSSAASPAASPAASLAPDPTSPQRLASCASPGSARSSLHGTIPSPAPPPSEQPRYSAHLTPGSSPKSPVVGTTHAERMVRTTKETTPRCSTTRSRSNTPSLTHIQLLPPQLRFRYAEIRRTIMRAETDKFNDLPDICMVSKENVETFENDHLEYLSPSAKSPALKSTKLISEYRMSGPSLLVFSWLSSVSIEIAMTVPAIAATRGGIYFLIPLFVCLFFITTPVICMQIALGQLTSQHASGVYETMAPLWKGMATVIDLIRMASLIYRSNVFNAFLLKFTLLTAFFAPRDVTCPVGRGRCTYPPTCHEVFTVESGEASNFHPTERITERPVFFDGQCLNASEVSPDGNQEYAYGRELTRILPRVDLRALWRTTHIELSGACISFFTLAALCSWLGFQRIHRWSIVVLLLIVVCGGITATYNQTTGKSRLSKEDRDRSLRLIHSDPAALWDPSVWGYAFALSVLLVGAGEGSQYSVGMMSGFNANFIITGVTTTIFAASIVTTVYFWSETVLLNTLMEREVVERSIWNEPSYLFMEYLERGARSEYADICMYLLAAALLLAQIPFHMISCDMISQRVLLSFPHVLALRKKFARRMCILIFFVGSTMMTVMIKTIDLYQTVTTLCQIQLIIMLHESFIILFFYGLRRYYINVKTMIGARKWILKLSMNCFARFYYKYLLSTVIFIGTVAGILDDSFSTINSKSVFVVLALFIIYLPTINKITCAVLVDDKVTSFIRTSFGAFGPPNFVNRLRMRYDERAARIYY